MRATCPFINLPEKSKGRWGRGITPAVMQRCQWVKPVLIAQVGEPKTLTHFLFHQSKTIL
jgi:hypothetical protein